MARLGNYPESLEASRENHQKGPMKPTKEQRAAAIEICARMIAEAYGVRADKMFTEIQTKCQKTREAKELLIYYLRTQGVSRLSMSRFLGRSEDFIRRAEINGKNKLLPADHELIARLPPIPNSLNITRHE